MSLALPFCSGRWNPIFVSALFMHRCPMDATSRCHSPGWGRSRCRCPLRDPPVARWPCPSVPGAPGTGSRAALWRSGAKPARRGRLAGAARLQRRFPWPSTSPPRHPLSPKGFLSLLWPPDPEVGACAPSWGSLGPRWVWALLQSMLQPLLTPRGDRWTRQGIAGTEGRG